MKETIMYGHRIKVTGMEHRDTFYHMTPDLDLTELYDPEDELFKLKVTESDHDDEDLDWGWWCNEENRFTHVLFASDILEMIFAYGSKVAEEKGQGVKLPVEITIIEE